MKGDFYFHTAQHEWENPPELEAVSEVSDVGTCPYCHKDLCWDGVDETLAWCETKGCKYDNGISEEANRERWTMENLVLV